MAELKGPIQFIGSMGNIRVYYNKTLKRYIVSRRTSPHLHCRNGNNEDRGLLYVIENGAWYQFHLVPISLNYVLSAL